MVRHVKQPLVLLVRLIDHSGQASNMFALIPFPLLCSLKLFTQDVHHITIAGR